MTRRKLSAGAAVVKEWLAADDTALREVVRSWLQETLEQEMTEAVGASWSCPGSVDGLALSESSRT